MAIPMIKDVSQIRPNLYLGTRYGAIDAKTLNSLQIKRVLTLDNRPLDRHIEGITYLFFKTSDSVDEVLLTRFEECHQFISQGVTNNDNVLVHCAAGVSRSATVVISYIMIEDKRPYEEAEVIVRTKRSIIRPNPGFLDQLRLFDKMGRKLDPMNTQFRQYLIQSLKFKILNSFGMKQQVLEDYLKRKAFLDEKIADINRYQVFKCENCRNSLFNELNVINKSNVTKDSIVCHSVYIEPLEWMSDYIWKETMGSIKCPNCRSELGRFNWRGLDCVCGQHKGLKSTIIKIDSEKLESP